MNQILQNLMTGEMSLAEVPCLKVGCGQVLIQTSRLLISAGARIMIHLITRSIAWGIIFLTGMLLFPIMSHTQETRTLFGYMGYLGVPSADIHDGRLTFDYTFLPNQIAYHNKDHKTDNWIFTSTLGFFPFLECYLSVYVAPQNRWKNTNYGAGKVREAGVKIKVINEKKIIPSIAIGIFDPDLRKYGTGSANPGVSSTFIVFTKHTKTRLKSFSIGYGDDLFPGAYTRLDGVFGGMQVKLYDTISLLLDYDAKYWGQGLSFQWKGIDANLGLIDWKNVAFRIGYNIYLLEK